MIEDVKQLIIQTEKLGSYSENNCEKLENIFILTERIINTLYKNDNTKWLPFLIGIGSTKNKHIDNLSHKSLVWKVNAYDNAKTQILGDLEDIEIELANK